MKICFIAHLKDLSGANLSLFDLAITYKNSGEDVTVILPSSGPLKDKLNLNGINTKIILSGTWVKYKNKKYTFKDFIKILLNYFAEFIYFLYFKKNRFDIIHFNSYIYGIGAAAALKLGIPYIWHIREVPEKYMGLQFYSKQKSINKVIQAKRVITISQAVYNEMLDIIPQDKLVMIYNGIKIENEYKYRIFDKSSVNIMIVGAITEIKNQMEAIKIIKSLKQANIKNIKLWIIGDIVEKEYYKKLTQFIDTNNLMDNIVFTGFKTNLYEYRMLANFALVCTNFEGFGRVTVEAMQYGQIIFGADTGGTRELIKNEINGILYPLGKENVCVEKIIKIINDKNECEKISQNAYQSAKVFSIEKTAESVINLYNSCIK